MRKMYLPMEARNDEEKKTGRASYGTLVREFIGSVLRCNNIMEKDEYLFDNIIVGDIGENTEIFQAYLCDVADYNIDQLRELQNDSDIILAYSELLELHVLLVTHYGTHWDYVPTSVELTEDF